ncbi:MAG: sulfite exporter TauE/SafE family protein [Candidatus Hydrogenedentes bacterium]|nr:sulfite exporter TauE/SafE family protein [Candidatus Hydrogenedentota bacterium]
MSHELWILMGTAVSIGFVHTVLGPDHYVPFVMMARARGWSKIMTSFVTLFCGLGHILSSVILGVIGIALGLAVTRLEMLESFRGNVAAWLLIAFGLVYLVYGLRRAYRKHRHHHLPLSDIEHNNDQAPEYLIRNPQSKIRNHTNPSRPITPWVLFTIFVFGPCEPLIPILMYPAAKSSFWGLVLVTGVFGITTLLTMLGVVLVSYVGISLLPVGRLERFTHAAAGAAILLCGLAIQFLGV